MIGWDEGMVPGLAVVPIITTAGTALLPAILGA